MTTWNTCRLCKNYDINRPVFRYGIRHYCHAECGLKKWGREFVFMIPQHEVGLIPWRALEPYPEALEVAQEKIGLLSK